ncbi:MAG: hypothetical protein IMY75_03275, partial [Chloroflexi bacterium]|nr:hypothetical protein [Chloroflexota bacterium]
MKQKRIVPIIIIAVAVIVVAAAGIYFAMNPDIWSEVMVQMEMAEPEAGGLVASGFIEAEEINIAPELG